MSNVISAGPINYALSNLLAPSDGVTHSMRFTLSMSGGTLVIPITRFVQLVGSDFQPQAMTVDNTAGSAAITVTETTYGWTRIVGAGATRTWQFPAVPGQSFTFTTAGAVTPILSFYDWPAFPDGDEAPGASGGSVTLAGPLPLPVVLTAAAKTFVSAVTLGGVNTVTTAGTAVTVFPAGTIPNKGTIYNPSGAPGILYLDPVNAAQTASPGTNGTTIELFPGGSWPFDAQTGAVTANSLSNGHAFAAFAE